METGNRSAKKIARADADGLGKPLYRRDLRVALAALDPADLGRVDTAAFGNFLLRHFSGQPGTPEVPPKIATHGGDRPRWRDISP